MSQAAKHLKYNLIKFKVKILQMQQAVFLVKVYVQEN